MEFVVGFGMIDFMEFLAVVGSLRLDKVRYFRYLTSENGRGTEYVPLDACNL